MRVFVPVFALALLSPNPATPQSVFAQSGPKPTYQQHLAERPGPAPQEQFLVYWTTEPGWNTELLLRNNLESSELSVAPALRTAAGGETALPTVNIKSGDVASIDLYGALMKAAPQLVGAWGSVVLRYTATVDGALYASAMVRADGRPIAFHLDAFGQGTEYEVGSREGIWWLPWKSVTDYLILTNSGDQLVQPNLVLYDSSGKAWQQKLSVGARQTQRLSIGSLQQQAGLNGKYGGIKIDVAKGARFLDSAHLLFDESGGFSAIMKMFQHDPSTTLLSRSFGGVKEWTARAPMLALSTPDPALGFPAGTKLQPKVFIRNTSSKTLTAHLRFNWRSATTSGKSTPLDLPLKANETQVIDVTALQAQKLLPADANWAAVILSASVLPDELLAVAASYDETGRYGAQTPFSDQLAPHWEGGKWEVDGTHNSLVTISNGGNKPELAQLTILYNHGSGQYQIEQMLAPDQQMALDFGKLIHDRVPDKNGQFLPPDLASGAYRILDLTDHAAGNLYEGKVIVDKTYGHAAYGCMICCGPKYALMAYNPLAVLVNGYDSQQVQSNDSCTGSPAIITDDFPTWWTDNTSIATANQNQITGVAVGTTNHHAQSVMMYWGPKAYSGDGTCPQDQKEADAGTDVQPCAAPNAESTQIGPTYNTTISRFNQTISDSAGDSFDGWPVTEGNAAPGQDTCWFSGSLVPRGTGVSGGTWTVAGGDVAGQHNHWGLDLVGFDPDSVTYYRANGPGHGIAIPCGATLYQSMEILCPSGVYWTYTPSFGNKLTATIEQTDVINCRYDMNNSACQTINY